MSRALDSQSEEISKETVKALREARAAELIKSWEKARSIIQSDPADSITRSSSYLESVCRVILTKTKEPIPPRMTMIQLVKAAEKSLDLSDDPEANEDLTKLFAGIRSIFQSVGSVRTHFGTAHGFALGDYVPGEHCARLVNDASATASTYLLRRLEYKLNKSMQSTSDEATD